MTIPAQTHQMIELNESECRELLGREQVGRVAYVIDGAPMIVPVDYVVSEGMIVFRSDPGDKASHIPLSQVCFEVDGADGTDIVWSVVVHGHARDVTTALNEPYEQIRRTPLPTFATLVDPHWLTIDVDTITGRRLTRST
jgi:uncharacterized protein